MMNAMLKINYKCDEFIICTIYHSKKGRQDSFCLFVFERNIKSLSLLIPPDYFVKK